MSSIEKAVRRLLLKRQRAAVTAQSGLGSRSRRRGWKRLEFLAGFETHGFARRDANLLPGARVSANAGLARLHVEYTEAAELDAFSAPERVFHGFEDGFHRLLGFRSSDIGFLYDSVHDVELDHTSLPLQRKPMLDRGLQVVKRPGV
jgi:hypothetical protein